MEHSHKKWFRRCLVVVMLFCLLLQSMRDTYTVSYGSSENDGNDMQIIVSHLYADGTSEEIKGHISEDSYYLPENVRSMPVADNDGAVRLYVKPKKNETFAGFATAAGHEAVEIKMDPDNQDKSYLEITYNPNVHLVKVNVFYKYVTQEENGADLGSNETEIREDGKVYNTSKEGLHTDKTVAAAEDSDGRTFDLTLESWYVGNNQANVGMVLDASGSMAFTSNALEPIKMTQEQIDEYGYLTYIPQDKVNNILNPLYTDNSKLAYSGYTYFVYDPNGETKEYVPIGYWDGQVAKDIRVEVPNNEEHLISHYPFNNSDTSLKNMIIDNDGTAGIVKFKNGKIEIDKGTKPSISVGNALVEKCLDLARPKNDGKVKAVMLEGKSVPDSDSFTISFAVNGENKKPVMWIGSKAQKEREEAWYAIFADTESKTTKVVSGKNITTAEYYEDESYESEVEVELPKSGWNVCTYVFEDDSNGNTLVTIYVNGEKKCEKSIKGNILINQEGENVADPVVIIGGSAWENDYGIEWEEVNEGKQKDEDATKYLVDELYIYDTALTGEDVKELYAAMWNPSEELAYAATVTSEPDKIIAELKNANTDGKGAGWYLVSSNSDWNKIMNEQLLTAKSYRGVPKDEVIYNQIVEIPENVDIDIDPMEGNTDKYIYTGNEQFKGNDGDEPAITIDEDVDWNGSIIFYIDEMGYLRCFCNGGASQDRGIEEDGSLNLLEEKWKVNDSFCSYVYEKEDSDIIKTEALQYALGSFVTRLGEVSPDSMVSAVRFGTQNVKVTNDEDATNENLEKLVLLDWTDDTMEAISMLGLRRGTENGTVTNGNAAGFDTSANDIAQYNYILTGGTATWTGLESYIKNLKDSVQDNTVSKCLIIFTDGKDTTGLNDSEKDTTKEDGMDKAKKLTQGLKEEGYKIYCVMLKGASAVDQQNNEALEFLTALASEPKSEYVYDAEDVESLTQAFTTKILDNLVGNLSDYTVQDYIDPRFNLVDADGTIIYLNKGGSIKLGESESSIPLNENGYEINVMKSTDNQDKSCEKAMLYYDSTNEMYYLQWQNQTIPACGKNANQIDIWKAKITVKAKDDFIGGNVILTNGNDEDMNIVYDPEDKNSEKKSFPRTAVNVALSDLTMKNESDIIYKGQTISPESLMDILGKNVEDNAYYEYLERYLSYISENEEYREKYEEITKALASGKEVEIPYMYLPDKAGTNQTGIKHKNDKIGTLIYQWEECKKDGQDSYIPKTENPKYEDFVTEDTDSRYYRLKIQYKPSGKDGRYIENNALISDTEYNQTNNVAGNEQGEITAYSVHQTDIVSGELVVEARVLLSDLIDMAEKNNGLLDIKETLTAVRTYNGEESQIKLELPFKYTIEELRKRLPDADEKGYISIYSAPYTELPIGEYKIYIDNTTSLKFEGISKRDILDGNGLFSDKYKNEGTESKYAAGTKQTEDNGYITFYLGIGDEQENTNLRLGHVVVTYAPKNTDIKQPDTDISAQETVSVIIDGVKYLSGRKLKKGEFVFELIDETGKSLRIAANDADGSFRFEEIVFDKEGIYTYILREKENGVEGITYDKKYYLVKVKVEKQEDKLAAEINYRKGEKETAEKAEFYNQYIEDMEDIDSSLPAGPPGTGDLVNVVPLIFIICAASLLVVITVAIRKKKKINFR